jgi:hypothetical protein
VETFLKADLTEINLCSPPRNGDVVNRLYFKVMIRMINRNYK